PITCPKPADIPLPRLAAWASPLYTRSPDPSSGQERRLSCQQCRGRQNAMPQKPRSGGTEHAAGPTLRGRWYQGNLEQYSLSAISALAERAVAAFVPRWSPRSGTVLTPGRRPRGPL